MRKFVLAVVLVLMASGAQAATLDVVGGGLLGASGVIVDGSSYNVEFLPGTCIALYNGCDEVSDFTFQTQAAALLAANALLDQVFLDGVLGNFDSIPYLTLIRGCGPSEGCATYIPFGIMNPGIIDLAFAVNVSGFGDDSVGVGAGGASLDTSGLLGEGVMYAVWEVDVVPEPNTALLLSLGLTGLAAKRRRSLRS